MGQSPFNRHVWFEKGKKEQWEKGFDPHTHPHPPTMTEEMVLILLSNLCFHVFTSKKDEIWIGKTDVAALFSACDRNWILSVFWGAEKVPNFLIFAAMFFRSSNIQIEIDRNVLQKVSQTWNFLNFQLLWGWKSNIFWLVWVIVILLCAVFASKPPGLHSHMRALTQAAASSAGGSSCLQVSWVLGCSSQFLLGLVKDGEIPAVKICTHTPPLPSSPPLLHPRHTHMMGSVYSPPPGKLNLPPWASNITVPVRWTRGCQFNPSETPNCNGHLYLRALRWVWVRWGCRWLWKGGVNIAWASCLLASQEKSVPKRENAELPNSEGVSGSALSAGLWKYPSAGNGHFRHLNILAHVGTNLPPQSQLPVRWLVCVSHAKSL